MSTCRVGRLALALVLFASGSALAKKPGDEPKPPAGLDKTPTAWREACDPLRTALDAPNLTDHELHKRLDAFLKKRCYQVNRCTPTARVGCWVGEDGIHFTGNRFGANAGATHYWVRVWYSPEVVAWLDGKRTGSLDHAMIVKEQFLPLDPDIKDFDRAATAEPTKPTAFDFGWWTTMVRSNEGVFDRWLWDENYPTAPDEAKEREPHEPILDTPALSAPCEPGWPGQKVDKGCYPEWASGSTAGCMRCHGSAKSEMTFASLEHSALNPQHGASLAATQAIYDWGEAIDDPDHTKLKVKREKGRVTAKLSDEEKELRRPKRPYELLPGPLKAAEIGAFVGIFSSLGGITSPADPEAEPKPFPNRYLDHVVAKRDPLSKPEAPRATNSFVTSDQCWSCHDGVAQLNGAEQVMKVTDPKTDPEGRFLNISPWGEWSLSLMGLAGRDPVFHAQLEWEVDHRKKTGSPDGECVGGGWEGTTHTCYRCHGVMGRRQLDIDRPGTKFSHDMTLAEPGTPNAKYGALARDGISCAVCHRMTKKDLDTPASYTGNFTIAPASEIYGPYRDDVRTLPMLQALGLEPKGRKLHAETANEDEDVLKSSAMCGSCHNVKLPKLRVGECLKEDTKLGYEQSTFLEWKNSQYASTAKCAVSDPTCKAQTCQGCHMPSTLPSGDPLPPLKIAGVEDKDYPTWNVASTNAHDQVDLKKRDGYARHTLLGLNQFVLEMFRQFPRSLGVDLWDYMTDYGPVMPRMELLQKSLRTFADTAAVVDVGAVTASGKDIVVPVTVTNNAGHKFPSGVAFRRAFLELQVQDANGKVLWASGRTSKEGLITDEAGKPLTTELSDTTWEPHYQEITAENQVQIYEERILDSNNKLTTSFIGIWKHVKDNRLLPKGWQWNDPANYEPAPVQGDLEKNRVDEVMPHGAALPDARPGNVDTDPEFGSHGAVTTPLCGCDRLVYRIPLAKVAGAKKIVATLYYQAIPPYYLRDRFKLAATKDETKRLFMLTSHLNTSEAAGSPIPNWRLRITGKTVVVNF